MEERSGRSRKFGKEYYYTKEELERLLRVVKKSSEWYYILFKLIYLTGRRVSEIVGDPKRGIIGLRPCDIDWNAGLVRFTLEKRGKHKKRKRYDEKEKRWIEGFVLVERDVKQMRVSQEVLDLLRRAIELAKNHPNPNLRLRTEYDRIFPMSRKTVHRKLKEYLKRAGITGKKRILHALRHSFAIHSMKHVKTAEDLRRLQEILGHTRLTTTQEYMKYKDLNEAELMEKVAKSLNV